ncbi:MAG: hypothetical protein WC840_03280 [Candidatus Peribacteraceae bacterium]
MSKIPVPEIPREQLREDQQPEKLKTDDERAPWQSVKALSQLLERKAQGIENLPKPALPRATEKYTVAKANVEKRLALIRRIEIAA